MKTLITIGSIIAALFLSWILFLNHVDINEIGVEYNSFTGKISKQDSGWHVTPIWVQASSINLLPMRVDIYGNSQYRSRFIMPKLVKFNPEYLDDFIKIEGFHYFGNRGIEFTFAQYAFSGKKWLFLDEIKADEIK